MTEPTDPDVPPPLWTAPTTPPVTPPTEPSSDESSPHDAAPPLSAGAPAPAASSVRSWIAAGVAAAVIAAAGGYLLTRTGETANASSQQAVTSQAGGQAGAQANGGLGGQAGQAPLTRNGAGGAITAIDGSTLTIEAQDRSGTATAYEVETAAETTFSEVAEGTVADLAVGDTVLVMGEAADDGTVTAARVTQQGDDEAAMFAPGGMAPPDGMSPPEGMTIPEGATPPGDMTPPEGMTIPEGAQGFPAGAPTMGTITAIDGSIITLSSVDGTTLTVAVTSETEVSVTRSITLADLAVGDTVRATGTVDGTTVSAAAVRRGELGPGGGGGFGGPGAGQPGQAPGGQSTVTSDGTGR